MAFKINAHQIVGLAFMPISGSPDTGNRGNICIIFTQKHLKAKPLVVRGGEEMIVDLETRVFLRPTVAAAKVGKHVKPVFRPKKVAGRDYRPFGDHDRYVSEGVHYRCHAR